jgi:hypothetical protein
MGPAHPLVPNLDTIAAMEEGRAGGLVQLASVDERMADRNSDEVS